MAEIAGVQGGATFALETMLISLQHRGSPETRASRTEYAAKGRCSQKTETTPQDKATDQAYSKSALLTDITLPLRQKSGIRFKHPSLPQLVAVWDPFKPDFWDI
jgi:hypothetical protein